MGIFFNKSRKRMKNRRVKFIWLSWVLGFCIFVFYDVCIVVIRGF